jgi:hypothetical protein
MKKKQIYMVSILRVSGTATSLRGRAEANKETGGGGGTRQHRRRSKNLIVTITLKRSRSGWTMRNENFIITICKQGSRCMCMSRGLLWVWDSVLGGSDRDPTRKEETEASEQARPSMKGKQRLKFYRVLLIMYSSVLSACHRPTSAFCCCYLAC